MSWFGSFGDRDFGVKVQRGGNRCQSMKNEKLFTWPVRKSYRSKRPLRSEKRIGLGRREQSEQKKRISSAGSATEGSRFLALPFNWEEAQSSSILRTFSGGSTGVSARTAAITVSGTSRYLQFPNVPRHGRFFDLRADGCVPSPSRTPKSEQDNKKRHVVDICSKAKPKSYR